MGNEYPVWASDQAKASLEIQVAHTMAVLVLGVAIDLHDDREAFIALMRERIDNTTELMFAALPNHQTSTAAADAAAFLRFRLHQMLDAASSPRRLPPRGEG